MIRSPTFIRYPLPFLCALLLLAAGCDSTTETTTADSQLMSSAGSIINIDNYASVLRAVATLGSVDPVEQLVTNLARDLGSLTASLEDLHLHPDLAYSERVDGPDASDLPGGATAATVLHRFRCVRGGSLNFYGIENVRIHAFEMDGCAVLENLYSGKFSINFEGRGSVALDFDTLTAEASTGQSITLTGKRLSSVANANSATGLSLADAQVEITTDDATSARVTQLDYTLAHVANDFLSGSDRVELRDGSFQYIKRFTLTNDLVADFTVVAPWSDGQALVVTINLGHDDSHFQWDTNTTIPTATTPPWENEMRYFPFAGTASNEWFVPAAPDDTFQWDQGLVTVIAADGSYLTLTPDAQDMNTFTLQLSDLDEPLRLQWMNGYQIDCSPPLPGCL